MALTPMWVEAAQTVFKSAQLAASPTNTYVLQTDGSANSWVASSSIGADEKVKVDTGATAGYLGAASGDGVLRTGANLSYTDGGNFVTLVAIPAGSNLEVQYNNSGAFGADIKHRWNAATSTLLLGDSPTAAVGISLATKESITIETGNLGVQDGSIYIVERASAQGDVGGRGQIWVKTATPNQLWFTDDGSTDYQLGVPDTDTKVETYGFGAPAQVPSALSTNNIFYAPVAHTGTITRIEAYVGAWAVTGAADTLTIVVEYGTIGATATDSSVTDAGGAIVAFGGDVALAVSQNDIIGVTTTTSADDAISEVGVIITVEY